MKNIRQSLLLLFVMCPLLIWAQNNNDKSVVYTPVEFNIENPAVREYFENTNSTLSATASNYDETYFNQARAYRPDQPNTKTITFKNANAMNVSVAMATDVNYNNMVLSATTTDSTYTLRNFVPGYTYYYKVTDAEGGILTNGALTITGQMRMIAVDNGFNIRDLGGWTGLDGKKVRYEQIYRGGSLGGTDMYGNKSDIPQADKDELYRLGIRAQLDLRAVTNGGKYTDEYSLHSYSRGETTLKDADFINRMTDYGAYNEDASVVSDVAWIIYELKRGKPVYFHCRQGADRTGIIGFVVECLLGCYGENTGRQLAMDYELTGFSQANLVDNMKSVSTYRGGTEAYGNKAKLFRQLIDLDVPGVTFNTIQERCYYYLNKYWADTRIDKADLDWFIKYMLNLADYNHPSWAASGDDLQTIAEKKANVVTYQ